jgi:hypothetical protein
MKRRLNALLLLLIFGAGGIGGPAAHMVFMVVQSDMMHPSACHQVVHDGASWQDPATVAHPCPYLNAYFAQVWQDAPQAAIVQPDLLIALWEGPPVQQFICHVALSEAARAPPISSSTVVA